MSSNVSWFVVALLTFVTIADRLKCQRYYLSSGSKIFSHEMSRCLLTVVTSWGPPHVIPYVSILRFRVFVDHMFTPLFIYLFSFLYFVCARAWVVCVVWDRLSGWYLARAAINGYFQLPRDYSTQRPRPDLLSRWTRRHKFQHTI